jgi:cell division cycle 2-like protein
MNNRGQIKVADFGLARKFGDPLGEMTQLVVTLWYRLVRPSYQGYLLTGRSPELLLGAKEYTTAVDMWSVGCIFAELMQKEPLCTGRGEIDQINKVSPAPHLGAIADEQIFNLLGQPNDEVWPGFSSLPVVKNINPIGPP